MAMIVEVVGAVVTVAEVYVVGAIDGAFAQ
jgi:hypothetical protein